MIDFRQAALDFAERLAARDYARAYELTSAEYRQGGSVAELQAQFEAIVPGDWGAIDPIEIGAAMEDFPGKRADDVGWVYVSLGGDVYSEAVTVVIVVEDGEPKIRQVEWGRP